MDPRSLHVAKWIGSALCVLMVVGIALGPFLIITGFSKHHRFGWELSDGLICVIWRDPRNKAPWKTFGHETGINAYRINRTSSTYYLKWWPEVDLVQLPGFIFANYISIPLWMPLTLIAVPTAYLWWRQRRRIRQGCCEVCGYDLRGSVSDRCSECGEAFRSATKR